MSRVREKGEQRSNGVRGGERTEGRLNVAMTRNGVGEKGKSIPTRRE